MIEILIKYYNAPNLLIYLYIWQLTLNWIRKKYSAGQVTLFAEGCRGSLAEVRWNFFYTCWPNGFCLVKWSRTYLFCLQKIIRKYRLRDKGQGQHQTYALGIKEVIYAICIQEFTIFGYLILLLSLYWLSLIVYLHYLDDIFICSLSKYYAKIFWKLTCPWSRISDAFQENYWRR